MFDRPTEGHAMNESEATALNRAAQFFPLTDDDNELPAVRIGGALVFIYVEADESGEPMLTVSIDTEEMPAGATKVKFAHNSEAFHSVVLPGALTSGGS